MQEHAQTKRICCLGECIGDIELKGGALDFGKSARLVCQQTCGESKKMGVSARKFQGVIPPKKKNFCVLCLKLGNFYMSAPPKASL
jgi:hypothetical protein